LNPLQEVGVYKHPVPDGQELNMYTDLQTAPNFKLVAKPLAHSSSQPQWMINEKRAALFEEAPHIHFMRQMKSLWHTLRASPRHMLGALGRSGHLNDITQEADLPHPQNADKLGYCCPMGDRISAHQLHSAYQRGLMPDLFAMIPYWAAPHNRVIYEPSALGARPVILLSLDKGVMNTRFDEDFERNLCDSARLPTFSPRNMWLSTEMLHHYATLFDLGLAHCFSVHNQNGKKIAGGFGVSIGDMFIIEGVFGQKLAIEAGMSCLNTHLANHKYKIVDITRIVDIMPLGAEVVGQSDFINYLATTHNTVAYKWSH
jgi:Leu/Phe-tRNA-protein transferase